MIIQYSRESICMGDDVGAGIYNLDIPAKTSIKQLMDILFHGGYGNTWPVPFGYNDGYWVIHSNIGPIAIVICDHAGETHFEYQKCSPDITIQEAAIDSVYACRPLKYWWKTIVQCNYKPVLQSLINAAQKLELLEFPTNWRMTHVDD